MNQETKRKPSVEKPWLKYYPKESVEMELPKCSIYSYLKECSKNNMDDPAIHYYGRTMTARELLHKIDETANAFAALGVKAGDIVAMVTVHVPESICVIYALNKIGAIPTIIDPRYNLEGIEFMIKDGNARFVFVIDLAFPKIKKIMQNLNFEKVIVESAADSLTGIKRFAYKLSNKTEIPYDDVVIKWRDFIAMGKGHCAAEAEYEEGSVAAITSTSGTTGFPKGVMITNDGMNAVSVNFSHAGLDYERGHRFLDIMPIFSSYGVVCGIHMSLTMGLETVLIPKFVPSTIGALVKKYKPNHMLGVPSFYEMLMSSKEMRGFDLSFFRMLGSGGDTMNAALEEKLTEFLESHNAKYPIAQGYGMSEVSAAASFCFNEMYKPRSVGIPSLTTTISVFEPGTTNELGYGQDGELCITGASIMKGYYNNPEETAKSKVLHPDGQYWIHSGDIGCIDEDGFVFINGRVKHMVIRFDGHKIFPVQIQSVIARDERVSNCGVVGVADRDHAQGDYPLAIVEYKKEMVSDEEAFRKELMELCDNSLEERGRPIDVVFVEELPLTAMGKIDVVALSKEYKDYDYRR
ncbi:MAG: acyl--CoA ligase [Eubacterium sp.]|nr:acyl--CoA ligase [Eubacterium sp.]